MFQLSVQSDFPAAHLLRGYEGKCSQLHGHTWKVCVTVQGKELNDLGMVVDFMTMKKVLAEVLEPLDHSYLNELESFKEINPTAENLAKYIYEEFAKRIDPVVVRKVRVWESDRAWATYCQS